MEQISWFDQLEQSRSSYISEARETAFKLLRDKEYITIDDVRKVCPPPDNIDGRVMGAIFTNKYFESVGYARSTRKDCHHRPIQRFRVKGVKPRYIMEATDTD